jgi:hypothetical protein
MVVNEKVVTLPYDPVWEAADWAKKHCVSYITNNVHPRERAGEIIYIDHFFADEKDATLFRLKWLNYDA